MRWRAILVGAVASRSLVVNAGANSLKLCWDMVSMNNDKLSVRLESPNDHMKPALPRPGPADG